MGTVVRFTTTGDAGIMLVNGDDTADDASIHVEEGEALTAPQSTTEEVPHQADVDMVHATLVAPLL